jgi:peroxiredoxin
MTGRTIDVGDRAPEFDLRRTFEQNVRLAELTSRGPVLVAFYVFDFGPI